VRVEVTDWKMRLTKEERQFVPKIGKSLAKINDL